METQDSSLKHLKESSRKHQLAQASNNNIIKERLLPITSREGNILFPAVFLKLPYSLLCKAEVCGRSDTAGFPVTWSHQQTHAWNTVSGGLSSAKALGTSTTASIWILNNLTFIFRKTFTHFETILKYNYFKIQGE